ncbi:MAG: reverse transcriptase-like protein [Elusimicrobia bacterium]|nr:reverse transcriptase-like protein [Elusimicrobiota bacterium]
MAPPEEIPVLHLAGSSCAIPRARWRPKSAEGLGINTNQVAEYEALIRALEGLSGRGAKQVKILTDSQFVVYQCRHLPRQRFSNEGFVGAGQRAGTAVRKNGTHSYPSLQPPV